MFTDMKTISCELPSHFSCSIARYMSSMFPFKLKYRLLPPLLLAVYGINTNNVFLVLVGTNGFSGFTGSSLPPHDARTMMEKRRRKKCLSIENKVESPTSNLSL